LRTPALRVLNVDCGSSHRPLIPERTVYWEFQWELPSEILHSIFLDLLPDSSELE
jgi:hypothetical protein